MPVNGKKILKEVSWILSGILSSLIFYFLLVNTTLHSPLKELWIILFTAIYIPILTFIILMFILKDYTTKYHSQYKEFLQRMIPGLTGGLVVFIATQFLLFPSSANIMDTVLPRIAYSMVYITLIAIIFFGMYVMIEERDKKKGSIPMVNSTSNIKEKKIDIVSRKKLKNRSSCPLTISDWIPFLNAKCSQRINVYYSEKVKGTQKIVLHTSIISIITVVVITTVVDILKLDVAVSLGVFIVILILFFLLLYWEYYKFKSYHHKFFNKVITTVGYYDFIIMKILDGEYKTSDEIRKEWKEKEKDIQKELNSL